MTRRLQELWAKNLVASHCFWYRITSGITLFLACRNFAPQLEELPRRSDSLEYPTEQE